MPTWQHGDLPSSCSSLQHLRRDRGKLLIRRDVEALGHDRCCSLHIHGSRHLAGHHWGYHSHPLLLMGGVSHCSHRGVWLCNVWLCGGGNLARAQARAARAHRPVAPIGPQPRKGAPRLQGDGARAPSLVFVSARDPSATRRARGAGSDGPVARTRRRVVQRAGGRPRRRVQIRGRFLGCAMGPPSPPPRPF